MANTVAADITAAALAVVAAIGTTSVATDALVRTRASAVIIEAVVRAAVGVNGAEDARLAANESVAVSSDGHTENAAGNAAAE